MTYSQPLISWIIPTHLPTDLLRLAIRSCLNQDYNNQEIIVVANGSQASNIIELVQEWFPDSQNVLTLSSIIPNLGHALNIGIAHARGEYVFRMDSDDVSYANRASKQVAVMQRNLSVQMVFSAFNTIDANGSVTSVVRENSLNPANISKRLFIRNLVCHPSCAFRRQAWVDLGGYRLHGHAEDYDLWLRMLSAYPCSIAYIKEPLIGFRSVGLEPGARRSPKRYIAMIYSQALCLIDYPSIWLYVGVVAATSKLIYAFLLGRLFHRISNDVNA